jgi:sarcosine oxidase
MSGRLTREDVDAVVVGGGVVGSATARALAARQASVVLLEQFSLEIALGSSRGSARIVAPFAYPDRSYLELGLRAMEQWKRVESSYRDRFLDLCGALLVGSVVPELASALGEAGETFELLSASAAEERFGVMGLTPEPILYEPNAGVIRADHARDALLSSAAKLGAHLREGERVLSLRPRGEGVELTSTRGRWRCGRVVVTAGPWTRELLAQAGIDLPLTASSQTIAYYQPAVGSRNPPAVIEFDGEQPYALPDPVYGLKVALHRRGPAADPKEPWEVTDSDALPRVEEWARLRFPTISKQPSRVEACFYTNTADERFILRREGPIVIGSACNGQGFIVAPESGEALARLALG